MGIEHHIEKACSGHHGPGLLGLLFPSHSCPLHQQVMMSLKAHDSWLGFHCDSTCHSYVDHYSGSNTALVSFLPPLCPAPFSTSHRSPHDPPSASFPPSIPHRLPQPHTLDRFSTMGLGPSFSFCFCSLPFCPAGSHLSFGPQQPHLPPPQHPS